MGAGKGKMKRALSGSISNTMPRTPRRPPKSEHNPPERYSWDYISRQSKRWWDAEGNELLITEMDKDYREKAAAHFIRNHGKKLHYKAVGAATQEVEDAEIDASSSSRISKAKENAERLMAVSSAEWAASLPVVRALRSRDGVIRKRKPGANKPVVDRVTF